MIAGYSESEWAAMVPAHRRFLAKQNLEHARARLTAARDELKVLEDDVVRAERLLAGVDTTGQAQDSSRSAT